MEKPKNDNAIPKITLVCANCSTAENPVILEGYPIINEDNDIVIVVKPCACTQAAKILPIH